MTKTMEWLAYMPTSNQPKRVVESISVECYDMKTEEEVWSADFKNGNEFVYYREEEVQW